MKLLSPYKSNSLELVERKILKALKAMITNTPTY